MMVQNGYIDYERGLKRNGGEADHEFLRLIGLMREVFCGRQPSSSSPT